MTPPRVRIVSIGDELLLGKTLDTNSHFLLGLSAGYGLDMAGAEIVGDEQGQIEAALRRACDAAELVLVTGGLGPTEDDRTRHALAAVLGVDLQHDAAAWQLIQEYYHRHISRTHISESNRRQCLLPTGTEPLINDRGTAPGILARCGACVIACLPGVPHEMRAMAERVCARLPDLLPRYSAPYVDERHVAGIGESNVQELLGGLLASADSLTIGITAQDDGHLCIRALGAEAQVRERLQAVTAVLGEHLLPDGCSGVAEAVVQRCQQRGWRITTAESCSCGNVLAMLGAVPGVSAILHQGWVTYHNDAKVAILGVDPGLIEDHGVVSEPVVRAMAEGARRASGAEIAIATSGIAGPAGGSEAKPVGLVHYAVATPDGTHARHRVWPGTRTRIQSRSAHAALLLAWECLRAIPH
ncbi:MAG: nicotinamide-nucleotide amidohydrolase family protein [Planctomycetota bacterium]